MRVFLHRLPLFIAMAIASHTCFARPLVAASSDFTSIETGDDKEKDDEGGKREGKRRRTVNKEGLKDLPSDVKKAAEGAVKGVVLIGADKNTVDGKTVYSVSGTSAGKTFVMDVSSDGRVLKVTDGGSGKDDGDDDDDHKERSRRRREGKSKKEDD